MLKLNCQVPENLIYKNFAFYFNNTIPIDKHFIVVLIIMHVNCLLYYPILLIVLLVVIRECVGARVCTPRGGCYMGTFMFSYPSIEPFDAFLGIPYANKPKRFEVSLMIFFSIETIYDRAESQFLNCFLYLHKKFKKIDLSLLPIFFLKLPFNQT